MVVGEVGWYLRLHRILEWVSKNMFFPCVVLTFLFFFVFFCFVERPIRSFELVSDVQASWNKDKMVNYLVLRMTPLDVVLNRSVCFIYILLLFFY